MFKDCANTKKIVTKKGSFFLSSWLIWLIGLIGYNKSIDVS